MTSPVPLRAARIIFASPGVGKRIFIGAFWRTHVALAPNELDDLKELRNLIKAGREIPERYYSATAGHTDSDPLLRNYGVMHLHLGGKGSDTLLFLMQFTDRVLLLETNTHRRFQRECAGLIRQHGLFPVPRPKIVVTVGRKHRGKNPKD